MIKELLITVRGSEFSSMLQWSEGLFVTSENQYVLNPAEYSTSHRFRHHACRYWTCV